MKRELFGMSISQKSKSEYFSATDLVRAGNKWRLLNGLGFFKMSEWLRNKSTADFIKKLEEKFGIIKISGRGRGKHTWIHPFLFIDMALAISPSLKIEVYDWLFDKLIKYRNNSGDSYKKMAGAIYQNINNKSEFHALISKIALIIQNECNVKDWQEATEKQLELRDRIHENIALLVDVLKNVEQAIKIGILKAKQR